MKCFGSVFIEAAAYSSPGLGRRARHDNDGQRQRRPLRRLVNMTGLAAGQKLPQHQARCPLQRARETGCARSCRRPCRAMFMYWFAYETDVAARRETAGERHRPRRQLPGLREPLALQVAGRRRRHCRRLLHGLYGPAGREEHVVCRLGDTHARILSCNERYGRSKCYQPREVYTEDKK